jgi:hypothetical protein
MSNAASGPGGCTCKNKWRGDDPCPQCQGEALAHYREAPWEDCPCPWCEAKR